MDKEEYRRLKSTAGQKRIELHGNPATPESCAKGGRIQGSINGKKAALTNRENGTAIFAAGVSSKGGAAYVANCLKNGKTFFTLEQNIAGGRALQAKDRKQKTGFYDYETARERGRKGGTRAMHNYWHLSRGRFNPKCELCLTESSHDEKETNTAKA